MYRKDGRYWDVIGEYTLGSPPVPANKSVYINHGRMRSSEQFFEHTDLPTAEEYEGWSMHKQETFANQEWDRRENGVWFMNKGEPTWIPGKYYFFLNYHKFSGQKPKYRNTHRRLYWVWCLFVMVHPKCLGLFVHTRRRFGKTAIAANIGWEGASGLKFFRMGIQSKTEDDARALFINEVRDPCMEMMVECPWFHQHTKGSNKPEREMVFDKPATSLRDASKNKQAARGGLKSKIDWRESTKTAYDSQGLRYFVNDEVGKKQVNDSWARHSVVSKQFYPDGEVIGKEFCMTTSDEDDDDAVGKAKEFWDNSDPAKLALRMGLARLFFPDNEGYMCDKYGYDTEQSLLDLDGERLAAEAEGVIAWIRRRRAYPRTIEEAHLPSAKVDCHFNQAHMSDVMTAIANYDGVNASPMVQRYDIAGEPGSYYFTKSANGPLYMSWLPPTDWLNKIRKVGTVQTALGIMPNYKPESTKFSGSADPFDNTSTLQTGSNGAMHVAYEWDSKMELLAGKSDYWPSHSFILEYAERPDDPDAYYGICLKVAMIFGCQFFCETNKVNFEKYFRLQGCGAFLAQQPVATMSERVKQFGSERTGAASSPRMIEEYMKAKKTFYQKYVGSHKSTDSPGNPYGAGFNDEGLAYDFRRMPFLRTINQDAWFNPADPISRRKSDLSVSHGFGLVKMTGFTIKPKTETQSKGLTMAGLASMMGMYN